MSGLVSLVGPWAASGCSGWSGGALAFDTFTVQHPCLVVAEELKGEKVEPLLLATQRPGSVAGSKAGLNPRVHRFGQRAKPVEAVPAVGSRGEGADVFAIDHVGPAVGVEALVNSAIPQAGFAVDAFWHPEGAVDALAVMTVGPIRELDRFKWSEVAGQGGDAHGAPVGDEADDKAVDCVLPEGEVVGVATGLVVDAD